MLAGLLWRARAGLRLEGAALRAGHGMADQNYRPPHLPYASVVGPLCVEVEPDRDAPRAVSLWVQTPGHLDGAARPAGAVAPSPAFSRSAWTATPSSRSPSVTVRWHRSRQRLVVSSGRRGVVTGTDALARQPSSVTLEQPSPFADERGLRAAQLTVTGRGATALRLDVALVVAGGAAVQVLASGLRTPTASAPPESVTTPAAPTPRTPPPSAPNASAPSPVSAPARAAAAFSPPSVAPTTPAATNGVEALRRRALDPLRDEGS